MNRTLRIHSSIGVAIASCLTISVDAWSSQPHPHGKALRGREHAAHEVNAFPHDNGPVPQARGQDLRPPQPVTIPAGGGAPTCQTGPTGEPATLVLYDNTGPHGWLGELYAMAAGNLASHFGTWAAMPVDQYQAGTILAYDAAIYIGSTYDQPLPVGFLDDVRQGCRPVLWMYDNIWQLANRTPDFVGTYGYNPWVFDTSPVAEVVYKGASLTRYAPNAAGIMSYSALDPAKASVLATAVRSDGATIPWAIRSNNLTYIGEIPFAYISEGDRYLAFCDLLFDALAPATPEYHRALVRIEDVHPKTDPEELVAIADYLGSKDVPFGISVIPVYEDPLGAYNDGQGERLRMKDAPEVAEAIRYMVSQGGTVIMHGYTHQHESAINPYSGVSADDFEFYTAHVNTEDYVIYDGPVPGDSEKWARGRINKAFNELHDAGLPAPSIFEYPHYAGSAEDSWSISDYFPTVYHRGLYFGGLLAGTAVDHARMMGQFFPYVVHDVYGWTVLPENLGNYEPLPFNNHPARLPADLILSAQRNLVIRDGFASFYFHPYLELAKLAEIVEGIEAAGYTFVSPAAL